MDFTLPHTHTQTEANIKRAENMSWQLCALFRCDDNAFNLVWVCVISVVKEERKKDSWFNNEDETDVRQHKMSDCIKFQVESIKSALAMNEQPLLPKNDGTKVFLKKSRTMAHCPKESKRKVESLFYCFLHVNFFLCHSICVAQNRKANSFQLHSLSLYFSVCSKMK